MSAADPMRAVVDSRRGHVSLVDGYDRPALVFTDFGGIWQVEQLGSGIELDEAEMRELARALYETVNRRHRRTA